MKKILIIPMISLLFPLLFGSCGEQKEDARTADTLVDPTAFHSGKDSLVDTLSYALGKSLAQSSAELSKYLQDVGSDTTYLKDLLGGLLDGLQYKDSAAIAYYCGFAMAMGILEEQFPNIEKIAFGEDLTRSLDRQNFYAGFYSEVMQQAGISVNGKPMDKNKATMLVSELTERLSEQTFSKEYAADRTASDSFMKNKEKEVGVQKLENGVLYKELVQGKGPHPTDGNIVTVTLEGAFIDGTKMEMDQTPIELDIRDAIPGLALALKNMKIGSEWEIYIPWQMAYGAAGEDDIKPFSTLIFKVKLDSFR